MDKVDYDQQKVEDGEISFKEIVYQIKIWYRFLLSNYIIIIVACIIGTAGGLVYSFVKKPVYLGELSFALQDPRSSGLSGAMGIAGQLGIDLGGGSSGGGEFSGDNLIELMKSRFIIEQTLLTTVNINKKELTLVEYYIDFNNLRNNWKNDPQLKDLHYLPHADRSKFSLKQDSVLGEFYKKLVNTDVNIDKIDKKLSIISIKVSSSNELFAKYFTESLASCVSQFYIQTTIKTEKENVKILQKQTDSVRDALNVAISGVASSVDNVPNANPFHESLRVPSQRRQVDVQANTAILNELIKNLEVSKMSLLQETPLIQIIDKPILPLDKVKVGKIKAAITGLILAMLLTVIVLTFSRLFKLNVK